MQTIIELLRAAPGTEELERSGLPRSAINNTFIPVTSRKDISPWTPEHQAQWILANYDYARSRAILNHFEENTPDGPYFISASVPLGIRIHVPSNDRVIMQDLTLTTRDNIGRWVNAFIQQARRQDFRRPDAKQQMFLHLRNAVSVVAELGPAVISRVDELIKWVSPTSKPLEPTRT
jgi:hypothetical protein